MPDLSIAMVNTEATRGGAARMAASLVKTINSQSSGISATLFHCEDNLEVDHLVGLKRRGSRPINAGLARLGGSYAVCDLGVANELIERTKEADVLHVHNLHGYYLNFEKLLLAWKERPVVWTWHDMWGATGRCGFAFDCEGWKAGCKKCPSMETYPAAWIDRARSEFSKKGALYGQMKNLTIVSPSQWLADIAIERGFDPKKVTVIPNLVDIDRFKLIFKGEARAELNLDPEKFVVLFLASDCGDKRKGYDDFAQVTRNQPWQAIAVGKPPAEPADHILHVGVVKDQKMINRYYAAADVMVIPTYADNYPNTVIESLLSGTPVVGYNEGGVASQLDLDGCKVVEKGSVDGLINEMKSYIQSGGKTEALSCNLSGLAVNRWSPDRITDLYLDLYQNAAAKPWR